MRSEGGSPSPVGLMALEEEGEAAEIDAHREKAV